MRQKSTVVITPSRSVYLKHIMVGLQIVEIKLVFN